MNVVKAFLSTVQGWWILLLNMLFWRYGWLKLPDYEPTEDTDVE